MRKTFLFFLLTPLLGLAQDESPHFVDQASGLVIRKPDGWDRDTAREQGNTKFAAVFSVARGKDVRFEVQSGPAQGLDVDAWLKKEQQGAEKFLSDLSEAFEVDRDFTIGGRDAVRFSVAGTMDQGGKEMPLRIRGCGVAVGQVFFRIVEYSYNGAHEGYDEDIEMMWKAVSFQAPGVGGGEGGGLDVPAGTEEPINVEDKDANYKLVVPPGWRITRPVEECEENHTARVFLVRVNEEDVPLIEINVFRFTSARAEDFTLESPTTMLERYLQGARLLDNFYGEGASRAMRGDIREGVDFAGAGRTGAFVYRGITLDQEKKRADAETLQRRGEKVEIPEFPERFVRGRVAMVSPSTYILIAYFLPGQGENQQLLAEYEQVVKSFGLLQTEALPPPLVMGGDVGNTLEERKDKLKKQEAIIHLPGQRVYKMQCTFDLPPGLKLLDRKMFGENLLLCAVGQDERHNWVRVTIALEHAGRLSERRMQFQDKRDVFASWRSNWESKARGAKFPSKEQNVKLGRLSGKGFKEIEGEVENFPGTFTVLLNDKSGWRTTVEIETRGEGHKVFEDALDDFFKSMKFKKLDK